MPFVKPPTDAEVAGASTLTVMLPGADVTTYEVTFAFSAFAGAVQFTVAEASPAVAVTLVGADGAGAVGVSSTDVPGTTELERSEAGPVPAEFEAYTVNVYERPFVRRVIVALKVFPSTVTVWPMFERTMYERMLLRPELAGAAHVIVALELPGVAATLTGAPGTYDLRAASTESPGRSSRSVSVPAHAAAMLAAMMKVATPTVRRRMKLSCVVLLLGDARHIAATPQTKFNCRGPRVFFW